MYLCVCVCVHARVGVCYVCVIRVCYVCAHMPCCLSYCEGATLCTVQPCATTTLCTGAHLPPACLPAF